MVVLAFWVVCVLVAVGYTLVGAALDRTDE